MNKVFALVQNNGCIAAVNSDAFLTDTTGWTELDAGEGDRYVHAQAHYLPGSLRDDAGRFRYKLVDGAVAERTDSKLNDDLEQRKTEPTDIETLKIRQSASEDAILFLMDLNMGGML